MALTIDQIFSDQATREGLGELEDSGAGALASEAASIHLSRGGIAVDGWADRWNGNDFDTPGGNVTVATGADSGDVIELDGTNWLQEITPVDLGDQFLFAALVRRTSGSGTLVSAHSGAYLYLRRSGVTWQFQARGVLSAYIAQGGDGVWDLVMWAVSGQRSGGGVGVCTAISSQTEALFDGYATQNMDYYNAINSTDWCLGSLRSPPATAFVGQYVEALFVKGRPTSWQLYQLIRYFRAEYADLGYTCHSAFDELEGSDAEKAALAATGYLYLNPYIGPPVVEAPTETGGLMTSTEARDALRLRLAAALADAQSVDGASDLDWPHGQLKLNRKDFEPDRRSMFLSPYLKGRGSESLSHGPGGGLEIHERTLFIRIALPKGTSDDLIEPIYEALMPHFENSADDDLDFEYGDLASSLLPGYTHNDHFIAVASFPFAYFRA